MSYLTFRQAVSFLKRLLKKSQDDWDPIYVVRDGKLAAVIIPTWMFSEYNQLRTTPLPEPPNTAVRGR